MVICDCATPHNPLPPPCRAYTPPRDTAASCQLLRGCPLAGAVNDHRLLVQDTADQYLRDRRLTPVMQAVIGGKFAQQIICRGVPYRSEKEEEFYQVQRSSTLKNAAAAYYGRSSTNNVAASVIHLD